MGEFSLSMGRAVYPWMDPVWAWLLQAKQGPKSACTNLNSGPYKAPALMEFERRKVRQVCQSLKPKISMSPLSLAVAMKIKTRSIHQFLLSHDIRMLSNPFLSCLRPIGSSGLLQTSKYSQTEFRDFGRHLFRMMPYKKWHHNSPFKGGQHIRSTLGFSAQNQWFSTEKICCFSSEKKLQGKMLQ